MKYSLLCLFQCLAEIINRQWYHTTWEGQEKHIFWKRNLPLLNDYLVLAFHQSYAISGDFSFFFIWCCHFVFWKMTRKNEFSLHALFLRAINKKNHFINITFQQSIQKRHNSQLCQESNCLLGTIWQTKLEPLEPRWSFLEHAWLYFNGRCALMFDGNSVIPLSINTSSCAQISKYRDKRLKEYEIFYLGKMISNIQFISCWIYFIYLFITTDNTWASDSKECENWDFFKVAKYCASMQWF